MPESPGRQRHSVGVHGDVRHHVMDDTHQGGSGAIRLVLAAVAAAAAAADNVQGRLLHRRGDHALQDGRHQATGLKRRRQRGQQRREGLQSADVLERPAETPNPIHSRSDNVTFPNTSEKLVIQNAGKICKLFKSS